MDTRWTKPIILTVPAFEDFRGYLAVPYDQSINFNVRQINQGYSKKRSRCVVYIFRKGNTPRRSWCPACMVQSSM